MGPAPTINFLAPSPTRANKPAIWSFAEQMRKAAGIRNAFDLPELIEKNDGGIRYIGPFDGDQTDAIVVKPDGSFTISLSSLTGTLRDNFTIAHELGHYFLHWPLVRDAVPNAGMRATRAVDADDESQMRCEWEANWFASAFLMPRVEFEEAFGRGRADYAASVFGVSPAAAKVRAKTLGL